MAIELIHGTLEEKSGTVKYPDELMKIEQRNSFYFLSQH
jgi:hypothetical protein